MTHVASDYKEDYNSFEISPPFVFHSDALQKLSASGGLLLVAVFISHNSSPSMTYGTFHHIKDKIINTLTTFIVSRSLSIVFSTLVR